MMAKHKKKRFTPEQLATIEAFYLLGELLGNLHGEIQLGLGPIAGLDDPEIHDMVNEEIVEGLGVTVSAVWRVLARYCQLLEIKKNELTDRTVEKLLGRTDVQYGNPNDDIDVAEGYTPASHGILAWKLDDRLNFLHGQTYADPKEDPAKVEPAFVIEIGLE